MVAFSHADMRRIAPAKINLALHVTGQRDDGHHLLESLVVFSESGDEIAIGAAADDQLQISGPFSGLIGNDPSNLVIRARDLLRRRFPEASARPVRIRLVKNLPVAAGIGGGSSDAAATLLALAEFWRVPVSREILAEIGLELGADVPMCLTGRPLVAAGIGERITALERFPPLNLLLVNPGISLSSGTVFAALAEKSNAAMPPLPAQLAFASIAPWLASTRNDLEPPAIAMARGIGTVLEGLRDSGAAVARMSGSGATCYGLFASAEALRRAEDEIRHIHPDWFVMSATSGGSTSQ